MVIAYIYIDNASVSVFIYSCESELFNAIWEGDVIIWYASLQPFNMLNFLHLAICYGTRPRRMLCLRWKKCTQ